MRIRLQGMALALIVSVGPMLTPAPVAAEDPWLACIESCRDEFWESDPYTVSIRGWCYIIRCSFV